MGRRGRPPPAVSGGDDGRRSCGPRFAATDASITPSCPVSSSSPPPPSTTNNEEEAAKAIGAKSKVERVYVGGMDPSKGITVSRVAERLRAVEGVRVLSIDECGRGVGDGDDDGDDGDEDDEAGGTFFFANVSLVDDGRNDSSLVGRRDVDEDDVDPTDAVGGETIELKGKRSRSARDVLAARYHNVKWRGCRLRIEPARMTFLERLALEIEERKKKREKEETVRDACAVPPPVGEEAQQPPSKPAARASAVRRHLRIRRRYGEEAYHVDTKPRRMVVTAPSGGGNDAGADFLGVMERRRCKLERLQTASASSSDGAKGGTAGVTRGRGGAGSVRAMHVVFCDGASAEERGGDDGEDVRGRVPDDGAADGDAASSVESSSSRGGASDNGGEVEADDSSTDESESTRDGGDGASSSGGLECRHSGGTGSFQVTRPPQKSKYVWSDDDEEGATKSASSSTSSPSSSSTTNASTDRTDTAMPVEAGRCDAPPSSLSLRASEASQRCESKSRRDGREEASSPPPISSGPIDSSPPELLDGDSGNRGGEDGGLAQDDGRNGDSRSSVSSSSSSTDGAAAKKDGPSHERTTPLGVAVGYVWSDDDDDDDDYSDGGEGGSVGAAALPEGGGDDQDIQDVDHPDEERRRRSWDIDRDVSENLNVLAGLFPNLASKAEAARRDLQKKRRKEEEGAAETEGFKGNSGQGGDAAKPHEEKAAAAVPSVLMRRYDPADVLSSRMYEVVGEGETTTATTEVPTLEEEMGGTPSIGADEGDFSKSKGGGIETDTAGSDRRQDHDDSSDTGGTEISEEASGASDASGDLNRTNLGETSTSGVEQPVARIYEQDRLERIFSQSKSREEDACRRHTAEDELGTSSSSPFTFAFADLPPHPSAVTIGAFSRSAERDDDRRSGRGGSNRAGVGDGVGSGGGFSFEFQIEGDEKGGEETNLTKGGDDSRTTRVEDAPNGKASDAEAKMMEDGTNSSPSVAIKKNRRRGIFFSDKEFLNDMEASFFDMNGGVERIASGGEIAAAEREAWFRERRALTLDWKRKQKRALAAPRRNRQRRY